MTAEALEQLSQAVSRAVAMEGRTAEQAAQAGERAALEELLAAGAAHMPRHVPPSDGAVRAVRGVAAAVAALKGYEKYLRDMVCTPASTCLR